MDSPGFDAFRTQVCGNPFAGSFRSILTVAPEITGLEGIRLNVDKKGNMKPTNFKFTVGNDINLLVAVTPFEGDMATSIRQLEKINFGKGKLPASPIIENAMNITELPALDVYAVAYRKGKHEIDIPSELGYRIVILGTIPSEQRMVFRDAGIPDAMDYEAFFIEGFAEDKSLFTVVGGSDEPVINVGSPGTEGIQGGFEGGSVVKINGVYHMFPTERAGEEGISKYYDRVKTRVGHWTSTDAIHWTRQSTILQSSGTYALVPEDNPMNDRRSALWSYMPVFSAENNRWYGFYLAYTTDRNIEPNHSFGRIWRCESEVEGIEGIGGPYRDIGIVIEPGLDSQLWEGRQGVASFYPYHTGNGWYAFISGAYPFETKSDYPYDGGSKKKAWYVGLAKSDKLEGPWTRMGEDINPVTSIHPRFVENPIVSRLPNGLYIAIFDGGPDYLNLPNKMGYTLSKDGLHWSLARYIPFDTKVKRWWTVMRTPLCLILEGDNIYTIVYTAWVNGRFNPVGMVKVQLDTDVLEDITNRL
ncbi:MAG: hypothetical protein LBE91_07740 [Tannerella sp.]|nr:hypothetical protein [Tannerella sp.]